MIFEVIEEHLIVTPPRLSLRKLALRGFDGRLLARHLRFYRQVLAVHVVHFLLRHQARLGLCDLIDSSVLEMCDVALRLHAVELVSWREPTGR